MAGLVLAIHVFAQVKKDVDARDEAGLMLARNRRMAPNCAAQKR
jgi:hypothetical protein